MDDEGRVRLFEDLFEDLFEAHFDVLLAYARRRTASLSDAEDVVAETFTVVWRRMDIVPAMDDERRPWLYGIARRVLANQRRSVARRARLGDRLRERVRGANPFAASESATLETALDALDRLAEPDRELLRLVAWEGLTLADVAIALGITANAAAIRVHRARRRLATHMKGSERTRTWFGWKGSVTQRPNREQTR